MKFDIVLQIKAERINQINEQIFRKIGIPMRGSTMRKPYERETEDRLFYTQGNQNNKITK